MPRSLTFTHQDEQLICEIQTVDRSKLYGSVSVETLDMDNRRCEIATLAIDGKTLIPNGGTALGYVNNDGEWISRKDLVAVDPDGEPLPEVESSFDSPQQLGKTVSTEEFLNHSIRLLYLLKPESSVPDSLKESLAHGDIHRIEFSYRGGVDTDPAFILMGEDDAIWMMVSEENKVQYTGLEQVAICDINGQLDTNEGEDDDDDEIDFGML